MTRPLEIIASAQNVKYKIWSSLSDSKGIKKHGLAILSGEKLIQEYLKSNRPYDCELVCEKGSEPLTKQALKIFTLSKSLFNELDLNGTGHSLLVIPVEDFKTSNVTQAVSIEVIAPLQDPRNLGALIRSCAAFGVKKVHLPPAACHPYHPKCLKVAANGFLHVEFLKCGTLDSLGLEGSSSKQFYILDSTGTAIQNLKTKQNLFLIVGEEGQGIPEALKKSIQKIAIPTQNIESLNATVAISIALYQLTQGN
ncbi:MAG: TrmH family RNA methyltransferase [Pseudobdellovibrionaceae bacterium]